MKSLFQIKTYLAILLIFPATSVWAQTDFQLTLMPTGNPITLPSGGAVETLTYTVTNNGPMIEGDQTTVTFNLNPSIEPATATSTDPSWICSVFTSQIVCDYFNPYAVGQSTTIELNITSPSFDTTIVAAVNASMTNALGDSNPGNEFVVSDIDFIAGVDLEVVKTISVGSSNTVSPGDSLSFDITVNSITGDDASNVVVMDDLSVNNLIFDAVNSSPECIGVGSAVQCSLSDLFIGSSFTFTLATTVSTSAISGGYTNTATLTANEPDTNIGNNSNGQLFNIITGLSADLDLTMLADSSTYNVGDIITLDLTLHNPFASTGAPPNTIVSTILPNEVTFSAAQVTNVPGWQCLHDGSLTGGVVNCNSQGNPVAIGTNTFIEIRAVASSAATFTFVDSTVTSDFDPMPSNDLASVSFAINLVDADLSIIFTSTSGVYNQGDTISYDIQVSNPMISTASPSDVNVSIDLPNEVAFNNVILTSAPGWGCVHDGAMLGGQINCDRGGAAFVSNSVHLFTVVVLANSPATNTIALAGVSSVADSFTSNNLTSQSDVINALVTDFSIVKTVSATDFAVGDSFTYYLTVTNDLASAGGPNDVFINDQLPAEVSYVSYIVGSNMGTTVNCTHDGAATGGLFSCSTSGTAFAVGEVVTIDVNVTAASASATVNNSATVATSTDPDGIGLNNISAALTVVINGPVTTTITATKTALVAGVPVTNVGYGENFDYVLQVDNTGANDAINTHVSDALPADVTLVGFVTTGWSCLPMTLNAIGETVDCTMTAPLASGANSQITLNVMATTNMAVSSIANQMEASGDNTGALVTSLNTVSLLNAIANLSISQNPSPVDLFAAVGFDLVFSNAGTATLSGVQVDSILPQDFIYNGFTADPGVSCTVNAGTVNCLSVNPLPASNLLNLTLNLTTPAALVTGQNYDLQVSANANELASPISSTFGAVFFSSEFAVNMFSDLNEVSEGQSFVHSLNIQNTGTLDLINVEAFIAFPSYGQLIGVQSSDMNCTDNLNIIQCVNLNTLIPNDNYKVDITFQVVGFNGLFGTSASVNGDGVNKSIAATTHVLGAGENLANDLSLVKSASVDQVGQQGSFNYVFDVMNVGVNDQTNFVLVDELPAGVIYQTASGNGWTCTGNSSISCQFNGILNSGSQSQLVMEVIAPSATGVVSNTANITTLDDNPSNNQSVATVEVVTGTGGGTAIADLAVQVTASNLDVINTEQLTWTIDVTNLGPDTAQNIRLENQFPVGFLADEVLVNGGVTCVLLSGSLVCELASMTNNQTIQINLTGGFNSGFEGQLMNVVDVTSDAIDPNLSNNQSQAQVNVTNVEDLSVDLALVLMTETQSIRQGDVFELKFKTKNFGPDRAIEPTISASLSGLISQVQIVNSGQWACQSNNSSLSCHYPGSYLVGVEQMIVLNVVTERVEQTSQPLVFNAIIESSAMDTNPANNLIGFTNEVSRTPTEDEIFDLFAAAVGSGASETVMRTIRNVSSYCARKYFMAIEGLCEEMIAGARPDNRAAIINVMEEITPNEVIGQSTSASEIITSQFSNIGSRLSELRGGGGSGFSVSGLNGRYGNESIPVGMLAYLNQSADEEQAVSNINDFISPWGFFVNGSISMGERDATGRELGFDFDTYGLTAGVDYRFSATKVAGVALGYANFDSKIEDEAEMKSTGFTLTGYGSFYIKDNFYVDARISYGNPDFDQKRRINFELDNIAIDRVATGKTDADQYSVAMSMGYHFNKNSWNITPNASVQYARTTINAFQESGAGGFNFFFGEQEIKSMVWSVGTSVSKAISLKNGVISPQFDFNLSRETENDGGLIEARFLTAPADEIFYIETDEPDRTYGSAGVGLVFIGANGKQAYINYRSIFGLEGFTRGTINIGARFEF